MTATLGHVTRSETGAFKGQLRTLNIRADIEIVPVRDKPSPAYPDYRVVASGIEIGAGRRGGGHGWHQDKVSRPWPVPTSARASARPNSLARRARTTTTSSP